MNPLVNTDVHRYVKDLIDRHIPNEAGKTEDWSNTSKRTPKRSEDVSSSSGEGRDK